MSARRQHRQHLASLLGGLALLITGIFVVAGSHPGQAQTAAPLFSDLPATHANFKAVMYLHAAQVMKGYPGTNEVRPDQGISRAELLKIAYQSAGITPSANAPLPGFADDDPSHWSQVYINDAFQKQVISGYPTVPPTFQRNNVVSRVETLKILFNIAQIPTAVTASVAANPAADVPTSMWYAPHVERALTLKLMELVDPGRQMFGPRDPMTRGTVAEVIYRLNAIHANGALFYNGQDPNNLQTAVSVLPFPALVPAAVAARAGSGGAVIPPPPLLPPLPPVTSPGSSVVSRFIGSELQVFPNLSSASYPYEVLGQSQDFAIMICDPLDPYNQLAAIAPTAPAGAYAQFFASPNVGKLFYPAGVPQSVHGGLVDPSLSSGEVKWLVDNVVPPESVEFTCDIFLGAGQAALNSYQISETIEVVSQLSSGGGGGVSSSVNTVAQAAQAFLYNNTPNDNTVVTCIVDDPQSQLVQPLSYDWEDEPWDPNLPNGTFFADPGLADNEQRWQLPNIISNNSVEYYDVSCQVTDTNGLGAVGQAAVIITAVVTPGGLSANVNTTVQPDSYTVAAGDNTLLTCDLGGAPMNSNYDYEFQVDPWEPTIDIVTPGQAPAAGIADNQAFFQTDPQTPLGLYDLGCVVWDISTGVMVSQPSPNTTTVTVITAGGGVGSGGGGGGGAGAGAPILSGNVDTEANPDSNSMQRGDNTLVTCELNQGGQIVQPQSNFDYRWEVSPTDPTLSFTLPSQAPAAGIASNQAFFQSEPHTPRGQYEIFCKVFAGPTKLTATAQGNIVTVW